MAVKRKPWFCQECRIIMAYNDKDDYYKCSQCGCEVWPADTYKPVDEIEELMASTPPHLNTKEVLPIYWEVTGASSKSKGGKNEKMKKDPVSKLNFLLYKDK